jgi:hypothetical protein
MAHRAMSFTAPDGRWAGETVAAFRHGQMILGVPLTRISRHSPEKKNDTRRRDAESRNLDCGPTPRWRDHLEVTVGSTWWHSITLPSNHGLQKQADAAVATHPYDRG